MNHTDEQRSSAAAVQADRSDPTAQPTTPTPKLPWHPPELFLLDSSGSRSLVSAYMPTEKTAFITTPYTTLPIPCVYGPS